MKRIARNLLLAAFLLTGCAATASAPRASQPHGLPKYPVTQVEELLRSYPGVRVLQRQGGFEVRVRGSLREPLYILDGLPLTPQPPYTLMGLNPHDVARIEVMTDPTGLAFYGGLRGAARGGAGRPHHDEARAVA